MIPAKTRVWVCTTPTDMRKSFDGLAAAVQAHMGKNPEADGIFVFVNKRGNRLKALWWDKTGYCLIFKRLEWGQFRLPRALAADAVAVAVDAPELAKILVGVGLPPKKHRLRKQAEEAALHRAS